MKKTRIAAMIIAAAMVTGMLGGCGGGTNATQGTSASSGTTQTTAASGNAKTGNAESETTQAAADEREIPTIVIYNNSGVISYNKGVATDPDYYKKMQDYIMEQIGVKVEIIVPPQENKDEKLGLLLAGGDQLDAWWGAWTDYYQDGIIIPINEYLDMPEAQNLYEQWDENHWDGWKRMTDSEGNIWGVPRLTKVAAYPIFVRNDWLELVGMDMPGTLDELNEYLYAVKELDPYGNGETIPLALGGGANPMVVANWCFMGGFVDHAGRWLDETDGKVKPDWIQDGYKDLVAQVKQWYEDGIIHVEYMGTNTATFREQIASGRAGAHAAWYSNVTVQNANLALNVPDWNVEEKGDYIFGMNHDGMTGPNGKKMEILAEGNSREALLISSKCEHPEAVMKFMEWCYEFENFMTTSAGFEGEGWKYADTENAKENHVTEVIQDVDYVYLGDFEISAGLPMETIATSFAEDGTQNMHNKYLQEWCSEFSRGSEQDIEWNVVWDSDAMKEACPSQNDINTYRNEQFAKFITGERSLDTWDQFIEECYDIGLGDYIDESTRQYNEWMSR